MASPKLTDQGELEDRPAASGHDRVVQVDTVDDANEGGTERDAPSQGTQDVAEEGHPLCGVQLHRTHLILAAANPDRRLAGGAQVAHPVDFAPRRPYPTPAGVLDDGQGSRARHAGPAAADGQQPVGPKRQAGGEEAPRDGTECPNPPWRVVGVAGVGRHVRSPFVCLDVSRHRATLPSQLPMKSSTPSAMPKPMTTAG